MISYSLYPNVCTLCHQLKKKLQIQVTLKPNLNCSMFGAVSVEEELTDETKKKKSYKFNTLDRETTNC